MKPLFRLFTCFHGRVFLLIVLLSVNNKPLRAQWTQTNGSYSGVVECFIVLPAETGGMNLFTGTDGGVFLTSNNDTSWSSISSGLTNTCVMSLVVSPNGATGKNLFAGTLGGGVFLSVDNGNSWTAVNSGLTDLYVYTLVAITNESGGTDLFAGTGGDGVFLSTDNGTSWSQVNTGLNVTFVYTLYASSAGMGGANLYAGTGGGGVYLSKNNGASWTSISSGLTNLYVRAIATVPDGKGGTNLFAGTEGGGIFISTNNGTQWTAANSGLTDTTVVAFTPFGTALFAGTADGIFLSGKETNWNEVSGNLTSNNVRVLAIFPDKPGSMSLYAGTTGGIWKRSLSEMITSMNEIPNDVPTQCTLSQNYPNPFNPSTTIEYNLPSSAHVRMSVYDIFGREVEVLVNQAIPAGRHEVVFHTNNLASGIYFYRIEAGSYIQSRKMILIK